MTKHARMISVIKERNQALIWEADHPSSIWALLPIDCCLVAQ